MSVFDDIIGNKELPDDMKITVGDKDMTLAELRQVNNQLAESRNQLTSLQAERDDYRTKHDKLAESITGLLRSAGSVADNPPPAPQDPKDVLRSTLASLLEKDDPSNALFEDKLFGRALTRVEERAVNRALEENKKLSDAFTALKQQVDAGFEGLTRAQVNQHYQSWYGANRQEIPKDKDGKRMSLKDIIDFAQQRGLTVPNTNLFDLDRTLDVITEPVRTEARMSEAERRGYEKGLNDGRAAAGKVLPLFGDRSAGPTGTPAYSTAGKSAKQIVSERLQQGLADLAAENEG